MTPAEREQMIRSSTMTANERFLLGLLDEARSKGRAHCPACGDVKFDTADYSYLFDDED